MVNGNDLLEWIIEPKQIPEFYAHNGYYGEQMTEEEKKKEKLVDEARKFLGKYNQEKAYEDFIKTTTQSTYVNLPPLNIPFRIPEDHMSAAFSTGNVFDTSIVGVITDIPGLDILAGGVYALFSHDNRTAYVAASKIKERVESNTEARVGFNIKYASELIDLYNKAEEAHLTDIVDGIKEELDEVVGYA